MADEINEAMMPRRPAPLCFIFLYFHFHESYHVGQMTMIAELLGRQAAYVSL